MGKYLDDKYLNSILENYFEEYSNYDIENRTEGQIKEYILKNKEYIGLANDINNKSMYTKLSNDYISIISSGSVGDIGMCIGFSKMGFYGKNNSYTNFCKEYDKIVYSKEEQEKQEKLADNFYRNIDIDKEYSQFISTVKKDYNKIKSAIKKIFKFDMYKLNLSRCENTYKEYKKLLQDTDSFNWHIAQYIYKNFEVEYNILFKRKVYDEIRKEVEIYVNNMNNTDKNIKISKSKIQQIKLVYDSFINWINNPRTISGHSNLSMYDIISIYVLFNKPIQDLCNRCKKGKFDKLYDISWTFSEDYNGDYFSKSVISNCGNKSKLIEHNGENDFVYNPLNNKIFYIGYEHEELISDFNNWDLLYVTDMFNGNIMPDDVKQIIEDYDKEKGYNFV